MGENRAKARRGYQFARMKSLIVLYERGQVEGLQRLAHGDVKNASLVALSLEVEQALEERKISFISARGFKHVPLDLLRTEDTIASSFLDEKFWAPFSYRGVPLRSTLQFAFRAYLQRVRYYAGLLASILEAHPEVEHIVLFEPAGVVMPEVAGALALQEQRVVVDVAHVLAQARDISTQIIPCRKENEALRQLQFRMQRRVFTLVLSAWNGAASLLGRRGRPRLVIGDYWKNVESIIASVPAGECLFVERAEFFKIPWQARLRFRMRFMHAESMVTRTLAFAARKQAQEFQELWQKKRPELLGSCVVHEVAFDTLLYAALDELMRGIERTCISIEGTHALYTTFAPDLVLLRASVSLQPHFSILPLVAKERGIPSLELQHGIEYLSTGSLSREHVAEYIGVYGTLIQKEFVHLGYAHAHIRVVGSPRLDHVKRVEKKKGRPYTVLCIAPDLRPFELYDSYSAEDYFATVVRAIRDIPQAELIVKLRPGSSALKSIAERVCATVPHSITSTGSMAELCARSDTVVSCFSTAVLEALFSGTPVVLPTLSGVDAQVTRFHFAPYAEAGALAIVDTGEALSRALKRLADPSAREISRAKSVAFLAQNFSLDGHATERLRNLITELTRAN